MGMAAFLFSNRFVCKHDISRDSGHSYEMSLRLMMAALTSNVPLA